MPIPRPILPLTACCLLQSCLNCPIQVFYLGCDEDEDARGSRRSRYADRERAAIHAR